MEWQTSTKSEMEAAMKASRAIGRAKSQQRKADGVAVPAGSRVGLGRVAKHRGSGGAPVQAEHPVVELRGVKTKIAFDKRTKRAVHVISYESHAPEPTQAELDKKRKREDEKEKRARVKFIHVHKSEYNVEAGKFEMVPQFNPDGSPMLVAKIPKGAAPVPDTTGNIRTNANWYTSYEDFQTMIDRTSKRGGGKGFTQV